MLTFISYSWFTIHNPFPQRIKNASTFILDRRLQFKKKALNTRCTNSKFLFVIPSRNYWIWSHMLQHQYSSKRIHIKSFSIGIYSGDVLPYPSFHTYIVKILILENDFSYIVIYALINLLVLRWMCWMV